MFNKIQQFFQNLFQSQILKAFKDFINQVFTQEKVVILSALKDIAIQAVAAAQTTGLDNEEKRKQVYGQILAYAKAKGIEVKDSTINLVIELAVSSFKKG